MESYIPRYDDWDELYALIRDVFSAIFMAGLVWSLLRLARAIALGGKVHALREMGEAYTPEEREVLIHTIKKDSLGL